MNITSREMKFRCISDLKLETMKGKQQLIKIS